ncbi:MAG: DUF1858 domain-containing protein [Oscillospiraceae bacterium]
MATNFIVDENSIIGEILDFDPETAPFFLEMGMHCLGCPSARGETLKQACDVHDIPAQNLIDKLNNHFNK